MQQLVRKSIRRSNPAFAGLMAAFVLLLGLFASSEKLHLTLHQDSGAHHHLPCAVCSFAEGQLEIPAANVSEVVAAMSVSWTIPSLQIVLPLEIDFSVASSRGPPLSVSSL
jgi:hypothetical protein